MLRGRMPGLSRAVGGWPPGQIPAPWSESPWAGRRLAALVSFSYPRIPRGAKRHRGGEYTTCFRPHCA